MRFFNLLTGRRDFNKESIYENDIDKRFIYIDTL